MNTAPVKTFYKRVLPSSCIAFSCRHGRTIFASALQNGGLKSFFALMEQHSTQSEPSYCALSTLVVTLNAFSVDPRQSWKGPWRWYHEELLNCCIDLDQVKETGITLPSFACLATCQGLSVDVRYAESENGTIDEFRAAVQKACVEDALHAQNDNPPQPEEDKVRDILVVSYNRKVLSQTGTGHFSPIAAYDKVSDSVLILDTARFKYGAHWVPLPLLHEAMIPIDPDTGRSRGFVLLSLPKEDDDDDLHSSPFPVSILFRYKFSVEARKLQADFNAFLQSQPNGSVGWDQVYRYWTRDGTDLAYVWNIIEPQYRPHDQDTMTLVSQVMKLIQQRMPPESSTVVVQSRDSANQCCTSALSCGRNRGRTLPLSTHEVIYIVYLSTLKEEERQRVIFQDTATVEEAYDKAAKEQLLAAADLIEKVIAMSGTEDTSNDVMLK